MTHTSQGSVSGLRSSSEAELGALLRIWAAQPIQVRVQVRDHPASAGPAAGVCGSLVASGVFSRWPGCGASVRVCGQPVAQRMAVCPHGGPRLPVCRRPGSASPWPPASSRSSYGIGARPAKPAGYGCPPGQHQQSRRGSRPVAPGLLLDWKTQPASQGGRSSSRCTVSRLEQTGPASGSRRSRGGGSPSARKGADC